MQSKQKVGLAVCASVVAVFSTYAVSQNTLSQSDIVSAVKQNSQAINSLKLRSMTVSSSSPGFFGPKAKESLPIINGRFTFVRSEAVVMDAPRIFIDQLDQKLIPGPETLDSKARYYRNPAGRDLYVVDRADYLDKGTIKQMESGAYETVPPFPLSTLANLQIQIGEEQNEATNLEGMKLDGKQEYGGLECYKFSWGNPENSPSWGYKLVCPSRSFRVVYSEAKAAPNKSLIKSETSIESFTKVDNVWIPEQVRIENTRTEAEGNTEFSVQKIRITDTSVNEVSENLLFEPMLAPGTMYFPSGTNASFKIIGGDLRPLLLQLQKGNFSILDKTQPDFRDQP